MISRNRALNPEGQAAAGDKQQQRTRCSEQQSGGDQPGQRTMRPQFDHRTPACGDRRDACASERVDTRRQRSSNAE